jgi:hypothetical protein
LSVCGCGTRRHAGKAIASPSAAGDDELQRYWSSGQSARFLPLTSYDIHRRLVVERKWSADQYKQWLGDTLVATLLDPRAGRARNSAGP